MTTTGGTPGEPREAAGTPGEPRQAVGTPDAFGLFAHATYFIVGGGLVLAFGLAVMPALSAQRDAPCRELSPLVKDAELPALELVDLDGRPVSSTEFLGKLVVLNFWATWCEPCLREWPELHRLSERLETRDDVVVVAVSIDKSREEVAPFLAKMGIEQTRVRTLWDPTQKLHERLGSSKIPDTYIVGPTGRIEQVYVNVRDWGSPAALHCIEALADR